MLRGGASSPAGTESPSSAALSAATEGSAGASVHACAWPPRLLGTSVGGVCEGEALGRAGPGLGL